jgi:hypothetical protein
LFLATLKINVTFFAAHYRTFTTLSWLVWTALRFNELKIKEDRQYECYAVAIRTQFLYLKRLAATPRGVSEVSRKNKKGGVIIPDDNIT